MMTLGYGLGDESCDADISQWKLDPGKVLFIDEIGQLPACEGPCSVPFLSNLSGMSKGIPFLVYLPTLHTL